MTGKYRGDDVDARSGRHWGGRARDRWCPRWRIDDAAVPAARHRALDLRPHGRHRRVY